MVQSIDKDFEFIDQIELDRSVLTRYSPNILHVKYKPGEDEFDVNFAKEQVERVKKICQGVAHHIIIDFTDTHISFSPDARAYFAENEDHNELRLSQSIIINSLAHKLVANFYMRFNKPKSPTVIVNNLEQALSWIKKRI